MGSQLPPHIVKNLQESFYKLFPERQWDLLGWPKFNEDVPDIGLFDYSDIGDHFIDFYSGSVSAGFPSPAADHVRARLRVDKYLIEDEDSTFFVTIGGRSMENAGLPYRHKAIINRRKTAKLGSRILAVVNGEFTMKYLRKSPDGWPLLVPANEGYKSILVNEFTSYEVWGVITGTFQRFE